MKKIMFNEPYGLHEAVLNKVKTKTRRAITQRMKAEAIIMEEQLVMTTTDYLLMVAPYQVGDVVAIAQRYSTLFTKEILYDCENILNINYDKFVKGWNNKSFVRAELMPHHIRITDVKVERIQDISDEDCMKEGIGYVGGYSENYYIGHGVQLDNGEWLKLGNSPREAFASLIDKIGKKGTWRSNPLVYVYSFELVD